MAMIPELERPSVAEVAPQFALPSLNGETVELTAYRGRSNVVVWFSRGVTCPFCRVYTDGVRAGYEQLRAAETEVIQVAPNLLESARRYFGQSTLSLSRDRKPRRFRLDPSWRSARTRTAPDSRATPTR